jgi:D-inositol-3-phosphate glycosyltransferase
VNPLRILFVLEYYAPHVGGVEVLFQSVAEQMARDGHRVTVFTQRLKGSPPEEILNGVRVLRTPLPRPRRLAFTFASFPRIYSLAREADLIHASTYAGTFSAAVAGWLSGKPVVLSVHEVWMDLWNRVPFVPFWQRWTAPLQENLLLNLPYRVYVTESQATLEALKRHLPGAGPVIHVPAAVRVPEGRRWAKESPGRPFTFIYFGRPGHWRGLDVLLKGFARLAGAGAGVRLDLILSREPSKEYHAILDLVRDLGVGDRVRVEDPLPRESLFARILEADAAVFPSLSEGFGLAAAEACALGIPVAASTAGSLPEVVSGRCLFFPPGDPGALTLALKQAVEGRWEWREPRSFPIEDCVRGLYQVYQKILPL